MATNLGTAIGYLTLDITGFSRGIDEATREIDRMQTNSDSALSKMGTAATKAGTFLTATVTAPVVGFGASILKEGTQFEEAMTEVKNVANLSSSDINEFREAINGLGYQMIETGNDAQSMYETMYNYAVNQGSETRFTAEEVAQALYYMGLAGWDAAAMVEGLRPILDLAAASNEDLATTSDIVTDSMKAMGYTSEDTAAYVNVLAEMMRSSNTTVKQAGEAFKYVAPLAGSLGYTIEDVAIAIGEFANVGVKGSQAGTGLRQALNSLTNPSDKAKEAMMKYNISLYNADGSAKSLAEVMDMLRGTFGDSVKDVEGVTEAYNGFVESVGDSVDELSTYEQGLLFREYLEENGMTQFITDWEKAEAVIRLVGIRALPGVLGIINDTDKSFNTLSGAIYGAQDAYGGLGSAVGMAQELMDTTQGSIYKLTSSISELRIQLFEFLQGPFQQVIDKLTDVVKWFNSLDDATQKNIMNWAGIAAAVGPALLIFGKLLTGISQISTAFSLAGRSKDGFAKNVTGTLNPALKSGEGLFAKLGGAVKSVGTFLVANADKVAGFGISVTGTFLSVNSAMEGLKQGGFKLKQWIEDILGGILVAVGLFVAGVTGWVAVVIGAVVAAVAAIIGNWDKISAALSEGWKNIKNFFLNVEDGINNFLDNARNKVNEATTNVKEGVSSFFKNIHDKGSEYVRTASASISDFTANAGQKVSSFTSDIGNKVSTFFSDLLAGLKAWFGDIYNNLTSLLSDVMSLISQAGQDIMNGIQNVFQTLSQAIDQLANFFKEIFSNVVAFVSSALSDLGSMITNFISGLISSIKSMIDTIMNFISGLVSHIGSALMDIFNTIKSFFEQFISSLGDVLNNIAAWLDNLIANIVSFVSQLWQSLLDLVSNFADGISSALEELGSGIKSLVEEIGNGVGQFLEKIGNALGDGIRGVVDKVKQGFSGILSEVFNIGKDIVMGIVNGIKDGLNWVGQNAGSIFGGLVDFVKDVFKIGSPSKLMADEVGYWLPLGIAQGFEDGVPDAVDDINSSVDDMVNDVDTNGIDINIGTSYKDLQTVLSDSYTLLADTVETTEERLNASFESMYTKMYSLILLQKELQAGVINNTGYGVSNGAIAAANTGNGGITNNSTGNTFIFNSPKAIDEIEAARQLEKTQRELEEGFI